jgi:ribosome-associated protein
VASLKKKTAPKVKKAGAQKPVAKKSATKKPVAKKVVKTAPKKTIAKKTVVKPVTKKSVVKAPQGLPEQMRDAVLKILDERQAEEIVCITLTGRSSVADYLIIASGRAGRQVAAIAGYLREAFFKLGIKNIRIEGQGESNWVLVDAGDVVIHLFRPEVRRYYDLDAMWNGKEIQK